MFPNLLTLVPTLKSLLGVDRLLWNVYTTFPERFVCFFLDGVVGVVVQYFEIGHFSPPQMRRMCMVYLPYKTV